MRNPDNLSEYELKAVDLFSQGVDMKQAAIQMNLHMALMKDLCRNLTAKLGLNDIRNPREAENYRRFLHHLPPLPSDRPPAPPPQPTRFQRMCMELYASGKTHAEIAEQLKRKDGWEVSDYIWDGCRVLGIRTTRRAIRTWLDPMDDPMF